MFVNKLKFIKPSSKRLYQQDIDFFKKIYELRLNHKLEKNRKELKIWYRKNRKALNFIFYKIMKFMDERGVFRNKPTQKIYDDYIEYCFNNSSI